MNNIAELQTINTLLGILLPFGVSYLSKASFSPLQKSAICFGLALLVAAVQGFLQGQFDLNNLVGSIFVLFTSAQIVYHSKAFSSILDQLEGAGPVKDLIPLPLTVPVSIPALSPDEEGK